MCGPQTRLLGDAHLQEFWRSADWCRWLVHKNSQTWTPRPSKSTVWTGLNYMWTARYRATPAARHADTEYSRADCPILLQTPEHYTLHRIDRDTRPLPPTVLVRQSGNIKVRFWLVVHNTRRSAMPIWVRMQFAGGGGHDNPIATPTIRVVSPKPIQWHLYKKKPIQWHHPMTPPQSLPCLHCVSFRWFGPLRPLWTV